MQFIDLAAQQERIHTEIETNIRSVLSHGKYIMGPEVEELEEELGAYVGVKHAIACSSGTDALLLALLAYGVRPGDAILTTPFTFISTAEVITLLGCIPVFVDIDPKTFNIDPQKLDRALAAFASRDSSIYPLPRITNDELSSSTPKGVIPVDLFGLAADYDEINAVAKENGLFVIEDAAQSFGAEYKGKKACSLADIACTSFFPAKPLGCYGDGGMCFTDDGNLAEIIESLRVHGKGSHKYDNARIGINGRLDTIQAAVLLAKWEIFPEEIGLRQHVAQRYTDLLAPCTTLSAPSVPEGYKSAWAQFSLIAQDEQHRSRLQTSLKGAEIPTAIYYPRPLHLQTAYAYLGYEEGAFPMSEDYSRRIFSLPMHPYLTEEEQRKIVQVILEEGH